MRAAAPGGVVIRTANAGVRSSRRSGTATRSRVGTASDSASAHVDLHAVEQLLGGGVQRLDPHLQLLGALDRLDGDRAGGVADLDPRGRAGDGGGVRANGHGGSPSDGVSGQLRANPV